MSDTASEIVLPESCYQAKSSWPCAIQPSDAVSDCHRLSKRLRRFAPDFPGAARLAGKLDACHPHHRCKSGACPQCTRANQQMFVNVLDSTCTKIKPDSAQNVVAISIMSPAWRVPVGGLEATGVSGIRHEMCETLERARNFDWVALGLDISLNDDTQKGLGVFWQIQMYGIAGVADRKKFASFLRKNFISGSDVVKRPVRVVACDGTAKAFSYALKTNFVKRVAYWGTALSAAGKTRQCWQTRKVALRAREDVELRLWLDKIGIETRRLFATEPSSNAFG